MNTTKLWQTALLALCCVAVFAGCASLQPIQQPPQVSLVGISVQDVNLFEQRFRLRLRIQNPNDASLGIRGMDYLLQLNDMDFARGVSAQATTIPAYGEEVIEVEAVSNLINVITQLNELEPGDRLSYRLSGGVSLNNVVAKVPFDYQGEMPFGTPSSR